MNDKEIFERKVAIVMRDVKEFNRGDARSLVHLLEFIEDEDDDGFVRATGEPGVVLRARMSLKKAFARPYKSVLVVENPGESK